MKNSCLIQLLMGSWWLICLSKKSSRKTTKMTKSPNFMLLCYYTKLSRKKTRLKKVTINHLQRCIITVKAISIFVNINMNMSKNRTSWWIKIVKTSKKQTTHKITKMNTVNKKLNMTKWKILKIICNEWYKS